MYLKAVLYLGLAIFAGLKFLTANSAYGTRWYVVFPGGNINVLLRCRLVDRHACSQASSKFFLGTGDEDYLYGNGLCGQVNSADPDDS